MYISFKLQLSKLIYLATIKNWIYKLNDLALFEYVLVN
jgi:hypothetical protein